MILIAIGANLPSERHGTPMMTCEAAVSALIAEGVGVVKKSSWYLSTPVPPSDQPLFVNGVVRIDTALSPAALLAELHRIETKFGRQRRHRNEARVIDLDLIDYDGQITDGEKGRPALPHPRMHERAFVLKPLIEVAPDWCHPQSGLTAAVLLAGLPADQIVEPMRQSG